MVAPEAAYAWGRAAAQAAAALPVDGAEAAAWTARGWAEVALGCVVLGVPAAFAGLDDVVREVARPLGSEGSFGLRLRTIRALAGPVPSFYSMPCPLPDAAHQPVAVPRRGWRWSQVWEACRIVARFCDGVRAACPEDARPCRSSAHADARTRASDLQWGERWRSAPSQDQRIVRCNVGPQLMWRTWMCLPAAGGPAGPAPVVIDVPFPVAACRRRIWRGLHDGAHLDHLAALARATRLAPTPVEFGQGLVVAESYAMAAEIVATVECLLAGETHPANDLRAGLIERIGRIPRYGEWLSSSRERSPALDEAAIVPSVEFAALPYLAGSYVTGPLRLLSGASPPPLLPARLHEALRQRWAAACDQFAPAAELAEEASKIG
jgi:hypothetical protein